MATIGEILGKSKQAGIIAAIEEGRISSNPGGFIEVIDANNEFCGYLSAGNGLPVDARHAVGEKIVRLSDCPEDERRLEMLRTSLRLAGLSDEQLARVKKGIDRLSGSRGSGVTISNTNDGTAILRESTPVAQLIARSRDGLFLGVLTIDEAQRWWPHEVSRANSFALVNEYVPFKDAYEIIKLTEYRGVPNCGPRKKLNDSIVRSINQAIAFVAQYSKREDAEEFWQASVHRVVRVIYDSSVSVFSAPLSVLSEIIGKQWFITSANSVQLTKVYSAEKLRELRRRALRLIGERYTFVMSPGSQASLRRGYNAAWSKKNGFSNEKVQKGRTSKFSRIDKANNSNNAINAEFVPRSVTRDERGLFLGVFSIDEATAVFGAVKSEGALLVVPRTVEFSEAAEKVLLTKSYITSFVQKQYSNSIDLAKVFAQNHFGIEAEDYWRGEESKLVKVMNNSTTEPICEASPNELKRYFGNAWYLVNDDAAQVMTTSSVGSVRAIAAKIVKERDADQALRDQANSESTLLGEIALLGKRGELVQKYLANRSKETVIAVIRQFEVMSDKEILVHIDPEVRRHPELYEGIGPYERIRLMATALANMHDYGEERIIENLLDEAHLFVFEDDAWWEAKECKDRLDHLPFKVCLTEDVLLWEQNSKIRFYELSKTADAKKSRNLMAFVVNRCKVVRSAGGRATYVVDILPPKEGGISAAAVVTGATTGSKGKTRKSRSPRTHERRGHWRNQAYGPGMKQHKRIWISETLVTPAGDRRKFSDPKRVHVVTLGE